MRSWNSGGSFLKSRKTWIDHWSLAVHRRRHRIGTSGVSFGEDDMLGGMLAIFYGACAYLAFVAVFLYTVAFLGGLPVPKTIDSGPAGPVMQSFVIDALLLAVFAVQHSVMARPAFKRWWTHVVPEAIERSTYVLFASLAVALLLWQWQPIEQPIWTVAHPLAAMALGALFWCGWVLVLASTFLISHFELFGLRQGYDRLIGRSLPPAAFKAPLLYKHVRHPLYLGFLIAFWSTPRMSAGHLLFAVATTLYILVGIQLEERDLVALFGDQYRRYRDKVAMLIPLPGRSLSEGPAEAMPPARPKSS
jgi:protein-S-isoprenylcysteine O-methyltransferase Ste14